MKKQSCTEEAFRNLDFRMAGHPLKFFFFPFPDDEDDYDEDEPEDPDLYPWPGAQSLSIHRVPDTTRFFDPLSQLLLEAGLYFCKDLQSATEQI